MDRKGQAILYFYDEPNRLIEKQTPDNTTFYEYEYDGLGRRISKSFTILDSLFTLHYIYDGEDILMEYDGANQLTTYYTHGPGIDEPLAVAKDLDLNDTFSADERFFYHTDALGSVTAITDSTGSLVESYQYDSFGNPTIFDAINTVIAESSIDNPYLFTAREFDSESGLYFMRARYYDPQIGRFISKDPLPGFIDLPQTLHHYNYTSNNPVNFIDPFGFFTVGPGLEIQNAFAPLPVSSPTILQNPKIPKWIPGVIGVIGIIVGIHLGPDKPIEIKPIRPPRPIIVEVLPEKGAQGQAGCGNKGKKK